MTIAFRGIGRRARQLALSAVLVIVGTAPAALADDDAVLKNYIKSMSDYVATQNELAFDYDASLDVVTTDGEIITIASSGSVVLERPDHLKATRVGGFADVDMLYDGKDLTVFAKNVNKYVTVAAPDSVDALLTKLHEELGFPLPAGDFLESDPYKLLMDGVTEVKGLGAGVIDGVTCDHLAFRAENIDWQIWITQGDEPRPCRYTLTTQDVDGGPRYTVDIRDWKTGDAVPQTDFTFDNTTDAQKVDMDAVRKVVGDVPPHFQAGEKE